MLETGRKDTSGIKYIVRAALAGGLFKVGANALGIWPEIMQGASRVGGSIAYFGSNLSPALLSVGYIVGLNIAVLMFLGGALNWYVAIPTVAARSEWPQYQLLNKNIPQGWNVADANYAMVDPNNAAAWDNRTNEPRVWNTFVLETKVADPNASPEDVNDVQQHNADVLAKLGTSVPAKDYVQRIWSKRTRYAGVGGMLIGGLWTIFHLRKSLLSGMTSGLKAYKQIKEGKADTDRLERDLPMQWIMGMIVGSIVPLFLVYQHYVQQVYISLIMAFVMLGTGFLFAAVAGYMAGLVGSSNNPDLRRHRLHGPGRVGPADAAHGQNRGERSGGRDHRRRGHLLCRRHRGRRHAGPQVRPARRHDALEAAGHGNGRDRCRRS